MTLSIGMRNNGELLSTDFFSRLEEDYSSRSFLREMLTDPTERSTQIIVCKDEGKRPSKFPDGRKNMNDCEKIFMVNGLVTDYLEPTAAKSVSTKECQAIEIRIPANVSPANGWKLSAEDEVLFRYFCVGKPAVWISTRHFNRDVPWCLV